MRPGEISRAHCGVLLLDEFPLFRADVINALRQPLESGDISVARAEESVVLPGPVDRRPRCQPVPVRQLPSVDASSSRCTCREVQRRDYRRKVTGPITDRIDITRHLDRPSTPTAGRDPLAVRERPPGCARGSGGAGTAERALRATRPGGSTATRPARRWPRGWPLTQAATDLVDDWLW